MTRLEPVRFFQVMTTVASAEAGQAIARSVLEARLAACVQIVGPIESHYWWQGKIDRATEWLCLIKTADTALNELLVLVRDLHSYDVPEITASEIVGDADYLAWISREVNPAAQPDG